MKFWDASGLVPLLVRQPQSKSSREVLLEDPNLIVWWGTRVELASALARARREAIINLEELNAIRLQVSALLAAAITILPDAMLAERAERLLYVHSLRAADALQLAAALRAVNERPNGFSFVSYDKNLSMAAQLEGFTVLAPAAPTS